MSKEETFRVGVHQETYQLVGGRQGPVKEANQFLEALRVRGMSRQTIRAYAYDLLALYRWMDEKGQRLENLTQATLLDFVSVQMDLGAHPNSINRRLVTCRLLYRFWMNTPIAAGCGASLPGPYYKGRGRDRNLGLLQLRKTGTRVLCVKAPRKIVEPLTAEQVRLFLCRLRRYRDLCIVYLMLLCGLRSREVLSINIADCCFEQNRLKIQGKGNKERILPLPELILQTISSYLLWERPPHLKETALFVALQGKNRGKSMTPAGLRSLFRHRRLDPKIAQANPHRFRHTFGADMARAGVRLPVLQKMMGHSDGRMTLQYINLSMADIADEFHRATAQIQKRYNHQKA